MQNEFWVAATLLTLCLSTVAFAYAGYPTTIYLLSKVFGRSEKPNPLPVNQLPFASLLIAAHNEEGEIERRLHNALSLDYPSERLEIVIASDGSTDDTCAIVRRVAAAHPGRIRLIDYTQNRGKASVLNDAFAGLRGEIIILSDANTTMREDSLRRLADWFAIPEIGVVCGRLVMTDPSTGDNVDSLYWKYETFLKKCESKLGALLGSNGAIYAIRKDLFTGVPAGTIIDDFYIPLAAKRRYGCRIVYETRAVACEETAPSIRDEFHRRSRIGAGGFQSIGMLWRLLWPRHGWISFSFLFHKVVRWFCPFLLIAAFALNFLLLDTLFGQLALTLQVGGYTAALLGNWVPSKPKFLRVWRLPTMFATMNAALLVGFFRWLFHYQSGTWKRTKRSGVRPILSRTDSEWIA